MNIVFNMSKSAKTAAIKELITFYFDNPWIQATRAFIEYNPTDPATSPALPLGKPARINITVETNRQQSWDETQLIATQIKYFLERIGKLLSNGDPNYSQQSLLTYSVMNTIDNPDMDKMRIEIETMIYTTSTKGKNTTGPNDDEHEEEDGHDDDDDK